MHISLFETIEPGQVYHVAWPKWTTDYNLKAHENWNATVVFQTQEGTDIYFRPEVKRVDVPLGTKALVLQKPGEGKHIQTVVKMCNKEHFPCGEVLCLVTTPDGHSFEAVVAVSQLWKEDPKLEYPPTPEAQGVDPSWEIPAMPEPVKFEKDSHLEACYFFRMLDRTPIDQLVQQLHTCLSLRHKNAKFGGRKQANDACRVGITMIRAKRTVMNASPEERAKCRLDE